MGLHRAIAVAVVTCCFFAAGLSAASAEGNRWALVIGITDYDGFRDLPNAARDATDFAAMLKTLGYADSDVILLNTPELTTAEEIDAAWQDLLLRAKMQPDGGTLIFYFAGHGLELAGQNFLIPQKAKFDVAPGTRQRDLDQIKAKSIVVQKLLAELAAVQETNGMSALFVLDACRNNPFHEVKSQSEPIIAGLAPPPKTAHEVFVMYSAGIGQEALDGKPTEFNSVYAAEFLSLFKDEAATKTADMPLSDLAQLIRETVYLRARKERHVQTPAYYDQFLKRRTIQGRALTATEIKPPENTPFSDKVATRGLSEKKVLIECSYCPELIVIPQGSYQMGDETGDDPKAKPHKVAISKHLAIGRFEVTVREWNQCVRDNTCVGARDESDPRVSLQPVTGVSWNDAQAFVSWLNAFTKKTQYRLPSEAEWEFAARAGSTSAFSFGNVDRKEFCLYANGADRSAGALLDVNTTCDDGVGREPAQRGSYLPNEWGLHDVHGNVWEWVQDCWNASYDGAPDDGRAHETGNCDARVARGGSWRSSPKALRSSIRHNFPIGHSRATLGFRVVRDLSDEEVNQP